MKFDCIIMNPPYQHGLYTDIFAEAQQHLNKHAKCVCLSPVNRYVSQIKNGKTNLLSKSKIPLSIGSCELVARSSSNEQFDIALSENLAVLVHEDNADEKLDPASIIADYGIWSFMKNVMEERGLEPFCKHYEKLPRCFSLRFGVGCGANSGTKMGFGLTSFENAIKTHITGHLAFVNFNSRQEQYNCWKTCWTDFMRFMNNLDCNIVPFLGNSMNPRTKKLGYEGEWTDDDLAEYLSMPENIKKKISNAMKEYRRIIKDDVFVTQ